jgi:serine/threonine protein phosphatase PrpC
VNYFGTAVTDVGVRKKTNQDSICMKIATHGNGGQVAMVVICDGMGGLKKGEVASATVVRTFGNWFDKVLPYRIENYDRSAVVAEWEQMLIQENERILAYGKSQGFTLGTTFTGLLIVGREYLVVHIGDTRAYYIDHRVQQLTEDHTVTAREIKEGRMTPAQAATDRRRHVLLQCIGASPRIFPQSILGTAQPDSVILLCSDGFRNKLTDDEIYQSFNPRAVQDVDSIERHGLALIDRVKERREQDNISIAVLKCV